MAEVLPQERNFIFLLVHYARLYFLHSSGYSDWPKNIAGERKYAELQDVDWR
jgi:hypothetical protein